MNIIYNPIGIIHSPYKTIDDAPRQPFLSENENCNLEILPKFFDGLEDVEKLSYVIVVYHLHLSKDYSLKTIGNNGMRGVFATRSPHRPNAIGISVVKVISVDGCTITVDGIDAVDGTPILDIKPFISEIDCAK